MPVLIAAIVISFIIGYALRDTRLALAIAAVLAVLVLAAFVWAFADDKGDDPWWTIVIGAVGAVVIVAVAALGQRVRSRRAFTNSP